VSACFSKGLGAPVGSVIAGARDDVERARRFRKMLGGGMRQVGILCAAALYALDHHRARLADDHANARRLAAGLAGIPGVSLDANAIDTNIVIFEVTGVPSAEVARRTEVSGVRLHAIAPTRLRAVTHLDVDAVGIDRAIAAVRAALAG
jgi:threonine aldolase